MTILTVPLLLALSGCDLQKRMLYYPDSSMPSQAELNAAKIRFWPAPDGTAYRGFIGTDAGAKGTFVVFHGNAGTAAHRSYYVDALSPLGYRVVLLEYPGYGARKGDPGEETFVNDARESLRLVMQKYGKPIFILGESLGCGVAASAVKAAPVPVDGIILITPWDTLLSVAREKLPWLPVRLFLRDNYDTISNLKTFRGRVAVVGAMRDEVIPVHHALNLYESLQGPKRLWTISNAGHNDWVDAVGPSWWREIADYVSGSSRQAEP